MATQPKILDVGTGSGCVAISLTLAGPHCRMTASDLSSRALKIARKNIVSHGLGKKVELVQSDLFGSFRKRKWNLIVSNPPYVPEEDWPILSREVLSEPRLALDGGPKGIRVIESILDKAPDFLEKRGWLLMEIGAGQSKILKRKINERNAFKDLSFVKDLAGIDRILIAQKNG